MSQRPDNTLGSLLAEVVRRSLPPEPQLRWPRIAGEGALMTLASVLITSSWNVQQAGVFSMFLSSAALVTRMNDLLAENREMIWTHKKSSITSNRVTALGILALFTGMMLAYVATASFLGESRALDSFGFALSTAQLGGDTIASRRFGGLLGLLSHNAAVLASFVVLAVVYRSFGALLALSWNACVWGVTLTLLVMRGITGHGTTTAIYVGVAVLALLPHIVLEAAAYVLGALAGIFLSKGLARYDLQTREFREVLRASGWLVLVASVMLVAAAAVEHWFPDHLLRLLRQR